ncbi:hypothetical protein RH08_02690 [Candidatus Liberibacter asiaticus]|uniref:Uncharacterized protein n=1 Tax=Candidatus Liberibacter asiaticus str. gxpsy TaxID=1174529 RepID=A0ABM5NFJ0_LIBAS|nr:hypothetical protein WSI_02625 [Candidatus Liberibacter asiaticus str. gxpsy]ASK52731.1 hypothetical protein B2I23_02695 [Candidatus Liberibacter asiaticus]BAP26415.1 hypothetical protein CGUJ_02775 [Candidatus Liberibacter asiaticus str. Ishi-1]AWL14054.1 hypothetical protein DIC79_02720 [Candidatus Liberibacter asiaticus]KIH95822.1 hypothetical protein RH08_02690 [Candidatus Liberibacter asiaticus]
MNKRHGYFFAQHYNYDGYKRDISIFAIFFFIFHVDIFLLREILQMLMFRVGLSIYKESTTSKK